MIGQIKEFTKFKEKDIWMIREQLRDSEDSGTIPQEILDFIYQEKLFKLFVPEEFGGRMLSLPEALRLFRKASRIDGTFGWLTAIGSGGGMFVPAIQERVAESLFSPKEAVLAGSGHPNGEAKRVEGGYKVTGEWKHCSGAPFATFFTASAVLADSNEVHSFIFMPEQVEVVHDWHAFGLKGTGSHTIQVQNAFVPEDRSFSIYEQQNSLGGAVHAFPFVPFSVASFAAVCIGIGEHFFEEARYLAERNRSNWTASDSDRYHSVLTAIERQEQRAAGAIDAFHDTGEAVWRDHATGNEPAEEDLQEFVARGKQAAAAVIQSADSLVRILGMDAVMETSAINRIWRDLHTAGQHTFLKPEQF